MNVYDEIAHLYATDDDPSEAVELPTKTITVEELNADRGAELEELAAHDLEQLVLLVKADTSDAAMVSLGLADPDPSDPGEIILNPNGRKVLARIIDEKFPGLREEVGS